MSTFKKQLFLGLILLISVSFNSAAESLWSHGKLKVSDNHLYLQFEDGTPFFWLADTGWLLPERTNREEASHYLNEIASRGYNLVQVQTLNALQSDNSYGEISVPDDLDFEKMVRENKDGYWKHMDFIIHSAASKGIFVGMTCIWGSQIGNPEFTTPVAKKYARFLADRYKNEPNIIWMIGGDIPGDKGAEIWQTMAKTIKSIDQNHLMTFHPRGRTTSAVWFNNEEWLDFNMFQSGHRRYGQRNGDADYPIEDNTEEDNWRYVVKSLSMSPMKPVVDGEPIYEDIPHGLHQEHEARWEAKDVRRFAYWSVFAGSFGHTYGHNSIMQFYKPGVGASFFPNKYWYDCFDAPGFNQMKYLKELILKFPFFDRKSDQSVIAGDAGYRYDRLIATRGNDFLMVYNYTGRPMVLDFTKITGSKKSVWWMNPSTGEYVHMGNFESGNKMEFQPNVPYSAGYDRVLIAFDADKDYLKP